MQLEPNQTPDSYQSLSCVYKSDEGHIKVFRNVSKAGQVFFHVASEPDVELISIPDDIETLYAFSVGKGETESQVQRNAVKIAQDVQKENAQGQ